jgi:hypothetical protein
MVWCGESNRDDNLSQAIILIRGEERRGERREERRGERL